MQRAAHDDEMEAVRTISDGLGLGSIVPTLIKAAHHTTFLLSPLGLVARVRMSGNGEAVARAEREIAVTRHLAAYGAPAVAPAAGRLGGPHVTAGAVVTLWPYIEDCRIAEDGDALAAAIALATIHRCLWDYAGQLPSYTHGLDRCQTMLTTGTLDAVCRDDRALLALHYDRLRRDVEAAAGRLVPLHGDAHPGNLLLGRGGSLWLDFEDACLGPAEFDIACLPPAAWPHFIAADRALVARCAELKSVCVAIWCAADRTRSAEIAEAADYHLAQVRQMPW